MDEVTIQLRNPPIGANKWQIFIIDDVGLKTMFWGLDDHDNIEDTAVFELSPDWLFPLSVDIVIYEEWQENGEWRSRQLYTVQSWRPIKPFTDEEDPTYRELFIPGLGSYYYNVATEALYEALPALALWPLAIIGGLGVLGVGATMAFAMARPGK